MPDNNDALKSALAKLKNLSPEEARGHIDKLKQDPMHYKDLNKALQAAPEPETGIDKLRKTHMLGEGKTDKIDKFMRSKTSGFTENIDDSFRRVGKTADVFKKVADHRAKRDAAKAAKAMAKGAGKTALKAIPLVGGIGAALASGDASAALPLGMEATPLGPQKGEEGYEVENPEQTGPTPDPAENKGTVEWWKRKLLEKLR